MQDDLLHAQASVYWAVAQFPAFQSRLDNWLNANVNVSIKELPPNVPNNLIVAMEKEQLPLSFNVEAGAYINAIRSSLDILFATLAQRHCPALIDDAYFPVASSPQTFATGNYKGYKFVKTLPTKERNILELLKPYKGGNELLWALHNLDIVRKHVRLLSVLIHPARLGMRRDALQYFKPLSMLWMRSSNDETVLGFYRKDGPQPELDFTAQVSLDETSYMDMGGIGIIAALRQFASLANSIILKFDSP